MQEKKRVFNYVEYISHPFEQLGSRAGVGKVDAYRCTQKMKDGSECKRVECSYAKMVIHMAVEHGIRRRVDLHA